jgi:DNA mismatch repair ATPase MutL
LRISLDSVCGGQRNERALGHVKISTHKRQLQVGGRDFFFAECTDDVVLALQTLADSVRTTNTSAASAVSPPSSPPTTTAASTPPISAPNSSTSTQSSTAVTAPASSAASSTASHQPEFEQLRRQLTSTQVERDGFRSERDTAVMERDTLKSERDNIKNERDRYKQQLESSDQAMATVSILLTLLLR